MSFQIPTHFVQQYQNNLIMNMQHKGSKLRPTVKTGVCFGEKSKVEDQVGVVNASIVTTRHGDTPIADTPAAVRWLSTRDFARGDYVDRFDLEKMIMNPQSAIVQAQAMSMARALDEEILLNYAGTAFVGKDGATPVTFPAGNILSTDIGGTGTGLNVEKLRAGVERLLAAGADLEQDEIYCVITSAEWRKLTSEILIISKDYNGEKPVLENGRVKQFLGVNFVHCEFTSATNYPRAAATGNGLIVSGTVKRLPMYLKSRVYAGIWREPTSNIDVIPQKLHSVQVASTMSAGATRLEESGCLLLTVTTT